jgi:hypothetical protein
MNRRILYAAGGHVLYLAVIGWLWSENQSLRKLTADRDHAGGGDLPVEASPGEPLAHEKTSGSPRPATPVAKNPAHKPVREPRIQKIEIGTASAGVTVVTMPQGGGSPENPEKMPEANESFNESKVGIQTPPGTLPPAERESPSILKNGGFDEQLSPWICENGKLVPDPADPGNSLLEVALGEGGLHLSQSFKWPAGKEQLVLSLRVKRLADTDLRVRALHLHLSDKDGNAILTTAASVEVSDDWVTVTGALRPDFQITPRLPASITIESGDSNGTLWIDDVTLK